MALCRAACLVARPSVAGAGALWPGSRRRLLRHRLKLRARRSSAALAWQAPSRSPSPPRARACATRASTRCRCGPTSPTTRCRTTIPRRSCAGCGSTTRSRSTARSAAATRRPSGSSARLVAARAWCAATTCALSWVHWSWFFVPHAHGGLRALAPSRAVPARGGADGGHVRPRAASSTGPSRPRRRGGPRRTATCAPVRRIMVEAGERFWEGLWRPLYDSLAGNPFAAMPSLHFGTSVMAAHVLSDVGRGHGALGWTYAAHARFRARLPGRALRRRPDRRLRAGRGGLAGRPARRAGRDGGRPGDPAAGGAAADGRTRTPERAGRRARAAELATRITLRRGARGSGLGHAGAARATGASWPPASRSSSWCIVAIYVAVPEDRRASTTRSSRSTTATWYWIVSRGRLQPGGLRRLRGCSSAGCSAARVDDEVRRAARHPRLATRSRWPGWRPRGSSRRRAPAASSSPTGRCARRACRAGAPACRMVAFLVLMYSVYLLALIIFGVLLRTGVLPGEQPGRRHDRAGRDRRRGACSCCWAGRADPGRLRAAAAQSSRSGYRRARFAWRSWAAVPATLATGVRTAIDYVRHPRRGALAVGRRDRLLGREHRDPVGELRGVRRRRPVRRAGPGLLRRHGREPDPVAGGRRRLGGRGHDRRVRAVRHPDGDRLPGGAHATV